MTDYKFEIMPCNWYKRREVNPAEIKVIESFNVIGFEKIDNSYCQVQICYDDNTAVTVEARVSESKVFGLPVSTQFRKSAPLPVIKSNWSINGINTKGDFILLKVKDND